MGDNRIALTATSANDELLAEIMDIKQIKSKFRKIIQLNPEGDYGYINDPLTESEVLEFEKKHNIKLPEDYRTFITNIFNGGFGPEQIMPLDFWDSYHNVIYSSMGNNLNEPFPLTSEWKVDFENIEKSDDYDEYDTYVTLINGTIRICHIGCGAFIFLVVNGTEYGNLWIDNRTNGQICPLYPNKRINFGKWYFGWLDSHIAHLKKQKAFLDKQKLEQEIKNKINDSKKKSNWLERLLAKLKY